jgi:CO/xanthine dehydrogenase Mo-binding subunit
MNTRSRRSFLQTVSLAGGAFVLGFSLNESTAGADTFAEAFAEESITKPAFTPNAWLRIAPDGTITVRLHKTEIGQGTATGLAMIVAEELDADWSRLQVQTIEPDGKRFMITGGSFSIAGNWKPCRTAGAAARTMLVQAAAAAWGVDSASCRTEKSVVYHDASKRKASYGELVEAASKLTPPKEPILKDPKNFTLIGKELSAKNLPNIVAGKAQYGIDVHLPNMLYAVIERSPVINGRIARVNDREALATAGVKHIVKLRGNTFPTYNYVRDGVAVVATSTWAALQARKKLRVDWHEQWTDAKPRNGAAASTTTLAQDFAEALKPEHASSGVVARRVGSSEALQQAFATATKTLDVRYELPLQAHAPLEPMNATAHWTQERCEVWVPTHFQSRLLDALKELTGLPAEKIIIHTTMVGGSFGRRLDVDYGIEAVMLSREIQAPVQVLWTREDDMKFGLYSPPSSHHVRVALDANGSIAGLEHDFAALSVWKQQEPEMIEANGLDGAMSIQAMRFPYTAQSLDRASNSVSTPATSLLIRQHIIEQPIRVQWWRRGYAMNHTFANESLMDECAALAGADPIEYRLRHLPANKILEVSFKEGTERYDTERMKTALRLASERLQQWGDHSKSAQRLVGRGVACVGDESYLVHVVEVSVTAGKLAVERVLTVLDCGIVINPQLVRAQVEGSIVFALTAALKGSITVEKGRVQQGNFDDYPLLRISEMPKLETILVPSQEAPMGTGEQISFTLPAALSNAIAHATGKRLRSLPMDVSTL